MVPGVAPVTSPVPLTVAVLLSREDHVTVRPVRTVPFASRSVTDNCTVPLVATLAECGLTVTEATGGAETVTPAVPILPSLVAVIVAEPTATAVTRPPADTVATDVFDEAHVMVRPPNAVPVESRGVAVIVIVSPVTSDDDVGLIDTVATGAASDWTAIFAVPLTPLVVAVIVALPAPCAVTSPVFETVAVLVSLLDQAMIKPVSTLPLSSFTVAESCEVAP